MGKTNPSSKEETKFDTMRLIQDVRKEDMEAFALDDIMREFSSAPDSGARFGAVAPLIPGNQKAKQALSGEELLRELNGEVFEAIAEEVPEDPEGAIVDQIQQAIDQTLNRDPEMAAPDSVIRLIQEEKKPPVSEAEVQKPKTPKAEPKPEPQVEQNSRPDTQNKTKTTQTPQTQTPPVQSDRTEAPQEELYVKPEKKRRGSGRKQPKEPEPSNIKVVKQPEPEPVPDAGVTLKKYAKAIRPAQAKTTGVLVLLIVSVLLTMANELNFTSASFAASNQLLSKILLGVMVLCALLSLDVVISGIKGIFSFRFTANSMIVLTFLVTAVDAVLCTDASTLPFCAVVCLQFYFANWGNTLRIVSVRRSLKVLQKPQEEPESVGVLENAWKRNSTALAAGPASEAEHVRGLLGNNLTDRCMGMYVPIMLVLSLLLAIVVRLKSGNSLTWAWSSMLICSLPLGGFICYYHPFAALCKRLLKEGAAVSGWAGVQKFAKADGILLKDSDIFPADHVTLNGMKVYGSYSISQVTGYAAAVMETSESGLTPLFQELRASNNGRMFTVSQFRIYEGGGYGAEIGGDVILLGSLRFMQLMGVYMKEGVKVRNAVYLSVNGEMCAVFALNYAPAGRVRKALRRIEEARHLTPVFATRDFLITPVLVHDRYQISPESLEFSGVEERSRLFGISDIPPAQQGGILTKCGFSTLTGMVTGSRVLQKVTYYGMVISMAGGIMGLVLMFFLTYLGAQAVSAMNVLLFPLLWTLPVLVLSGWVKRY